MTARNCRPVTARPHSATMTVPPAKTTADPAVAVARLAADLGSIPSARYSRARDMMNSA